MQRVLGSIIIILMSLLVAIGPTMAKGTPTEYQVKAAFLFNFLKYITWPAESPGQDPSAYRIGLIGTDPFGTMLDDLISGRSIEGRPVQVSRLSDPDSLSSYNIVFVSGLSDSLQNTVFIEAERAGVVTVGETSTFIADGGTICLRLHDDQVRFDINLAAANRSGLKVSSKLLHLAQRVSR